MTEFPWDVKKGSDNKSPNAAPFAPELPAFLTGKGESDESIPSPANSMPDILASAFSGMPMEEIKIEMPSFENKPEGQPAPFAPPNFGNMNDLSGMFNQSSKSPESAEELKPSFSPQFPPQFSPQSSPQSSPSGDLSFLESLKTGFPGNNQDVPPMQGTPGVGQLPLNDTKLPSVSTLTAVPPHKVGKRSPPPLFKLQLPDEEIPNTEVPGLSGEGLTETTVSPFSPKQAELKEEQSRTPVPFPGALPENPFSPFSNSLPDYVAPSPDPFTGLAHLNEDPSKPLEADSISIPPMQQQSPFAGHADFKADPYSSQMQPPSDPFPGQVNPPLNPFGDPTTPSANPFPDPVRQSSNPFATSPGGNPFPGGSPSPFDPFTGSTPPSGNTFPGQMSSPPGPISPKPPILKMDVLRKNLDSAGTAMKSLLKGLVMGKSLIERMEEIRDEPVPTDAPVSQSPFAPDAVRADPFSGTGGAGIRSGPATTTDPMESANPFASKGADVWQGAQEPSINPGNEDIRKVIPIEDPLMELKEEHRFDLFPEEEVNEKYVPDLDNDLLNTIPVGNDDVESLSKTCADKEFRDPVFPEDVLSGEGHEKIKELTLELRDMREEIGNALSRFADIDSNVLGLSANMEELGFAMAGLKEGEQRLADTPARLGFLDEKVVSIENGLVSVLSENSGIRDELTKIEEGISELVNSYTALLVQMHESSQETDARFSRLEDAMAMFSQMEDRLCTMEKSHGESQSMSMELAKTISSLMDGLGTTSGDLREFKEASELNNARLKENLNLMTEYVESELTKIGARSYKGYGQSVHLSSITKNSTNMKLCMEWLEFLMGLVGRNNLPDILSYYEELGWLTEQVRSELMHYAEGIDFYMEKPDWKLTPDDHVKSIWFIESLAGLKVDKNRLSVIDRDIERVKKGTEIYGI
ncbi:FlaD/FlaE family flagellar protein [Methanolobus sp.]|uniref:FlaD/FlaE family flagellar protein n=1 Tax=Methanolobus sp. TaxID=1874737 RepID=UPI0025F6E70D|nr:FlaD/FlaE family flagellar protein [Methanolobus sp.]